MGTILNQNKRPQDALAYYQEANQIIQKIRDTATFASSHYNLGLTFKALKQYDSAFYHLQNAVLLSEKNRQSDLLAYSYGAIAESFLELGKKTEGKKYLLLENNIAVKIGNLHFQAMCNSSLAEIAFKEKDLKGAIQYYLRADSLLKKNPLPVLQMNVDSMMFVACSSLSRFEEALAWHLDFVKIKDNVIGEKQTAQLNKVMVEYGTKEKNLTISKQQVEIRSKKTQLQLLALSLILTLLFIALLFRYIIKTRRSRESLYQKEKYLDQQLAEREENRQFLATAGPANLKADKTEDQTSMDENVENPSSRYSLYLQLQELLTTQKLYLDPEMNMQTLITILGTNKKYLYQAIAGYGEENFRSLINRYRVDESKRIIEHNIKINSMLDMSSVYSAAGFNSATSFYRIFKQYTGLTPAEYANEARKEMKKTSHFS